MNQQTSETLRMYFRRVTGIYPELFNTAHVICGNFDLAEYVVRNAIVTVWQQNIHGGMGFNEALRNNVKQLALKEALSSRNEKGDFTWNGFDNEETENPFLRQAAQESPGIRRALLLRYGCKFSVRRISKITEISSAQLKNVFNRFEARCRRRLNPKDRRRFEYLLSENLTLPLKDTANIPDFSAMYRAFEAEAAQTQVVSHRFSKLLGRMLTFILAIICALIFWLFAVISAPPVIEAPVSEEMPQALPFEETPVETPAAFAPQAAEEIPVPVDEPMHS